MNRTKLSVAFLVVFSARQHSIMLGGAQCYRPSLCPSVIRYGNQ